MVLDTAGNGCAPDRINTVNIDTDGFHAGAAEALADSGQPEQTRVECLGEATRQRSQNAEAVFAAGRSAGLGQPAGGQGSTHSPVRSRTRMGRLGHTQEAPRRAAH